MGKTKKKKPLKKVAKKKVTKKESIGEPVHETNVYLDGTDQEPNPDPTI